MYRRIKSHRSSNEYNTCNSEGNQLIVLGAIISTIISQEIQNDDELNNIGNLFIAVGSNLVLAAGQRATCNSNLDKNNITYNSNNEDITLLPNTNLPVQSQRSNKMKKVKKTKKMKKRKKIE